MKQHPQNGFTLYELLITVIVIALILAIGVPNLGEFSRNSRVSGTTNDLHGSFLVARSEAARAKENVTICASAQPFGAALCDGASFDEGWIIFVDIDGDIARSGLGENVLKAFPPVDENIDVSTNEDATYFSYAPTGLGRGDVDGQTALETAMICDQRGNVVAAGGSSAARRLVVTPVGRSTVIRDQATIAASGDSC